MKSRTSFCNATLFNNTIRRYLPLWIAMLILLIFDFVLPLAVNPFEDAVSLGYTHATFSLVVAFIGALIAFSHLNNSASSVFFGSLPAKRSQLFLTMLLAGFVPLLAVDMIAFVLSLLAMAAHISAMITTLLLWLVQIIAMEFIFFGIAVFCMQLTGLGWMSMVLYFAVNVAAYMFINLTQSIMSDFIYGYSPTGDALLWLSPYLYINSNCSLICSATGPVMNGWLALWIYVAVALVLLVASFAMYSKRNLERSSEALAFGKLELPFECILGIFMAALVGDIGYEICFISTVADPGVFQIVVLCVFVIIGAFMGYLIASMLVKKSIRIKSRNLIGASIVSAVCVVFALCIGFDALSIETKVPEADSVSSVSISNDVDGYMDANSYACNFTDEQSIEAAIDLHQTILEDHENGDIVQYASGFPEDDSSEYFGIDVCITYTLDSGKTINRVYNVCGESSLLSENTCIGKLGALCDSALARQSRYDVFFERAENCTEDSLFVGYSASGEEEFSVTLSKSQIAELVEGPLHEDLLNADAFSSEISDYWSDSEETDESTGTLDVYSDDYYTTEVEVGSVSTPATWKWLQEHVSVSM